MSASLASRPRLSLVAFAHSGRLGPKEAAVRVTAETLPQAVCVASAATAHSRLRLPALVATEGAASWKWAAPAGAPAGLWRFNVRCHLGRRSARTSTRTHVRVGHNRSRAGLMFPNSLEVPAGRLLHSANLEPSLSGSRGGAISNPGDPSAGRPAIPSRRSGDPRVAGCPPPGRRDRTGLARYSI